MAKNAIKLNWKTPSEKVMAEFVGKLEDEDKKSFAKACVEMKDGKNKINKSKAKAWLTEKFDSTGEIEWIDRPKNAKTISSADTIASWLNL